MLEDLYKSYLSAIKPKKKVNYETKSAKNENQVLIAKTNGTMNIYSLDSKKFIYEKANPDNKCMCSYLVSKDKKSIFAYRGEGVLSQIDLRSKKVLQKFKPDEGILHMITTNDGQYLLAVLLSGKIAKIEIKSNKITYHRTPKAQAFSLECTKNSKFAIIGYSDGYVSFYDIEKELIVSTRRVLERNITSIAVTLDDKYAYVGQVAGGVAKIDIGNFEIVETYMIDENNTAYKAVHVTKMCITNDQEYLIIASNHVLNVFSLSKKEVVKKIVPELDENPMNMFYSSVIMLDFIDNGKKLLKATMNGCFVTIDIDTLEIIDEYEKVTDGEILEGVIVF